jgi:Multiubiquitin
MARSIESTIQTFRFFVDGKLYESDKQVITGEELRKITGIRTRLRIFLGDHGPGSPDHQITKRSVVDLAQLGAARFYTLARPSYDIF